MKKQLKYEPDNMDYVVNIVWNSMILIIGATLGTLALKSMVSAKYFSSLCFSFFLYFILLCAHFSVRRLDKKYRDKLLLHPEAYLFIYSFCMVFFC